MRKFPFRFDLPFGNCQTTPAPSINHRRETCVQVKTQIIFPTTLANTNIITAVGDAGDLNGMDGGILFKMKILAQLVWFFLWIFPRFEKTHTQAVGGGAGWNISRTRFVLYLPSKSGLFSWWHESSNFGKRCFIIIILLLFAPECTSIISCERESFKCANHVLG